MQAPLEVSSSRFELPLPLAAIPVSVAGHVMKTPWAVFLFATTLVIEFRKSVNSKPLTALPLALLLTAILLPRLSPQQPLKNTPSLPLPLVTSLTTVLQQPSRSIPSPELLLAIVSLTALQQSSEKIPAPPFPFAVTCSTT